MVAAAQVAMQQTAVDPATGTIDMDLIQTGISAGARQNQAHLNTEVKAIITGACSPPIPFVPFSSIT